MENSAESIPEVSIGQSDSFRQLISDGAIFDKYRIIRLLGKGGMAEVYLAEHLLLNQYYALKVLNVLPDADESFFAKRFFREAKCFHQLNHPNIVRVFDFGCDRASGRVFMAMEYIDGRVLASPAEHTYSEDELLQIAVDIAKALQHLDENGIVHRDVKPANIMVTKDGVHKLMDLGIAKMAFPGGEDYTLTFDHKVFGTPAYASPEQCQAPHKADRRADIYSLGVTLYHLACGKLPFSGKTPVETIVNVISQTPAPLKKMQHRLSEPVVELIECMMDKSPDNRPQSAAVLLGMINSIIRHKGAVSSWRHRIFTPALAVITISGVVLIGLALWFLSAVNSGNEKETKKVFPEKAIPAKSVVPVKKTPSAVVKKVEKPTVKPEKKPDTKAPVPKKQETVPVTKERISAMAGHMLAHHGNIKKWEKAPVPGWFNHFGYGYQAARSENKPMLVITWRKKALHQLLRNREFNNWLSEKFIIVFFDASYEKIPVEQRKHIYTIRRMFGVEKYWPSTVVIDRDGYFRAVGRGFVHHRLPHFRDHLEKCLKALPVDNSTAAALPATEEKK